MPLPHLEIVEVVRRRDLHRARALLRIGVFVGNDGNTPPDQRQDDVLADQRLVALIVRMHRDRCIAEHRLRPRGGDDDVSRGIFRVEGLALDRIAQVPEVTLGLDLHHFQIGNRRQQLGIPIDQPLVLVDESLTIKLHKNFKDGAGQPLVHGEALARPVAGGAETLELVDDGAAGFLFPRPDALEELSPAHVAPALLLPLHQLPLDHHLRGDAGVIGARLPQHVPAPHTLKARQDILQRVVERMAHMQ